MIGWVAASGSLDRARVAALRILFLWQFPHFHAIAWITAKITLAAGIMMLPVVDARAARRSGSHSVCRRTAWA